MCAVSRIHEVKLGPCEGLRSSSGWSSRNSFRSKFPCIAGPTIQRLFSLDIVFIYIVLHIIYFVGHHAFSREVTGRVSGMFIELRFNKLVELLFGEIGTLLLLGHIIELRSSVEMDLKILGMGMPAPLFIDFHNRDVPDAFFFRIFL
jgi:hypothetical protein